ncbi:type II toxin-antitoxin system VapC family toxin [Candidatus Curtissbacteria bacterium]|nr:type II toxin-antitoxin system VapC family toxin [Candidatus Curtissbacteria bacterium]
MMLIDTDVIVDYARGFTKAQQFLNSTYKVHKYSISVVTAIEFVKGARDKRAQKIAEDLISKFSVMEITDKISKRSFELIKKFHLNYSLALADSLIASTALEYKARLLTKNQKDFDFIPSLSVESPY